MSVTYTVTEADGFQHTRTSARHLEPQYPFAVVRHPHGRKHLVSFHGTEQLARQALSQALSQTYDGKASYPEARLYPTTAEVKLPRKRTA